MSMTRTPFGAATFAPTSTILPSRTSTEPFGMPARDRVHRPAAQQEAVLAAGASTARNEAEQR